MAFTATHAISRSRHVVVGPIGTSVGASWSVLQAQVSRNRPIRNLHDGSGAHQLVRLAVMDDGASIDRAELTLIPRALQVP